MGSEVDDLSINNLIESEIEKAKVPENVKNVAKEIFVFERENWNLPGIRYSEDYDKIITKNLKR